MNGYGAWRVSVSANRGNGSEVKSMTVGANNANEAVAKVEEMLKSRFVDHRLIRVMAIDIEELRLSKKKLRMISRREAMTAKREKQNYFGKTHIRNYTKFVKLNYLIYYNYPEAA